MEIEIGKIKDTQSRREHGDISDLKKSIQEVGLINPLTINQDGRLMAGRRRFQALTELGWENVPVRVVKSTGELFDFRVALVENISRKNLSDPEESAAIAEYDEMKRKLEGEKKAGGDRQSIHHSVVNGDGWTQDKTAADLGISQQAVSKAKEIDKAIKEKPDRIKLKTGTAILRDVKKVKAIKNLEDISTKEAKKIQGLYDVIVVDPPWPMEKIERDCRPNQVALDYPTMSEAEISDLKIPCAKDAHVFLWTTHKFLPMAFRLIEKWDLRYSCTFVWHKNGGYQPYGLPQFNCEFCLLARRGNPIFIDTKAFCTCFNAPRKEHSVKPVEFYEMVKRAAGGRRLNMFARQPIEGYAGWGKEAI